MTDLTTIKTPFSLLSEETQAALKAHGGPYEFVNVGGKWEELKPSWVLNSTYRVKPTQPREWFAVGAHLHDTRESAEAFRKSCADQYGQHHLKTPIIRMVEAPE